MLSALKTAEQICLQAPFLKALQLVARVLPV